MKLFMNFLCKFPLACFPFASKNLIGFDSLTELQVAQMTMYRNVNDDLRR